MATSTVVLSQSTLQIVVKILEVLNQSTDASHGLTVREISRRVGSTEKTVRGHLYELSDIRPFGRLVKKLTLEDLDESGVSDSTVGWCMEPVLDATQMRLLIDSLGMLRMDGEYQHDLVDKLRLMSGGVGSATNEYDYMRSPLHYNPEFPLNVENLNDAIAGERVVKYQYCQYDMRGNSVPLLDETTGAPRQYVVDPYRLFSSVENIICCRRHAILPAR